jgi:hypothetical protein
MCKMERVRYLLLLCLLATNAGAETFKEKKPSPKTKGKLYAWKTTNDFPYLYRVPKSYNPKKRATLLLVLQGKDRKTHFDIRDYAEGRFRPDDILVFPGQPEPQEGGGATGSIEYKANALDARVIRGIHLDFLKVYKIQTSLVYGTGKGGSFALYYAGIYPTGVDGVVADAAEVWKETEVVKEQEQQAVLMMSFMGDARVDLAAQQKGFDLYESKGVKKLHLSVVYPGIDEHFGHPSALAGQLAWCEAMTTTNSKRLASIYKTAARTIEPRVCDYSAWHALAKKCEKKRAVERIEKLAELHVAAIRESLGDNKTCQLDGKPWLGHFLAFRRGFATLPACVELVKELQPNIDAHAKFAKDQIPIWKDQRTQNPQAAFWGCAQIIRKACLDISLVTPPMVTDLEQWHKEAAKHALPDEDVKAYETYVAARTAGMDAYHELNKRFRP